MPMLNISDANYERLKKFAIPLEDDVNSVIGKVLDLAEQNMPDPSGAPSAKRYDASSPPNLSFTTLKSVKLGDKAMKPADNYWNKVMFAVIREATEKGATIDAVLNALPVNSVKGLKADNGYHHLEDLGLSVQGQDANGAWKAIYALATKFKVPLEIVFSWQANPKAAVPNGVGSFLVQ